MKDERTDALGRHIPRAMQAYQLMRIGSVILTAVILAKSGLSTADIGQFESLLFIGGTVLFLGLNGLLQGVAPVFSRIETARRPALFSTVFWVMGAMAAGVYLLLMLGQKFLIPALTGRDHIPHFEWYCLFLLLNLPTLPLEMIFLARKATLRLLLWGGAGFGGQLLAVGLPLFLGKGIAGALMALVALAALKLVWTLVEIKPRLSIDGGLLREYWRFSWPLAANSLIGNMIGLVDGVLVAHIFAGDAAVFARFRYGSREFPVALALATALGTAMIPALIVSPEQGRRELIRRTNRLFHLVFPLAIVLIPLAPGLFSAVFNPEFAAAAALFNIYLLITPSRVLLPNTVLTAMGRAQSIFGVSVAELALKIALGWWWGAIWGLEGIAWSFVVGCWFEKLALAFILYRRYGIALSDWLNVRLFVLYTALLLMVFVSYSMFF